MNQVRNISHCGKNARNFQCILTLKGSYASFPRFVSLRGAKVLLHGFKLSRISFQHLSNGRGNGDGLEFRTHQNVPSVTLGNGRTGGGVHHGVVEPHGGSLDLGERNVDFKQIVVFRLPLVSQVRLHHGKFVSGFFERLVGESSISAPRSPRLLEPEKVVSVVSVPHHVGFAVANSNPLDGGSVGGNLGGGVVLAHRLDYEFTREGEIPFVMGR